RYSWISPTAVSFDRFGAQLHRMSNPVVGDLESLPFHDGTFEGVVCVGPVINYVSALEAISEMSRVLRQGGSLLLHFESSDSLEHLGTSRWRKRVAPLRTINNGKEDVVWI
ncbi:MAG TPA: methyltransferase domain-containing protein, partial [Acidobacteriaceae bacterium]|nr:methyltransferase domain-containing protein [Acidobacteriaceae bacterium]